MRQPNSIRVAVIMAGGVGERFWPLSRRNRPKQLLPLAGPGRTLIEEAVDRITPLIDLERVFVATAEHLREPLLAQNLPIPEENIIAEPVKRNTAGCLVLAAAHMLARFDRPAEEISMAVLTADHLMGDAERFRETVDAALGAAEAEEILVTIGIPPARPETGYGYIEIPENAQPVFLNPHSVSIFTVERFREKPSLEVAQEYLKTGRFLWNGGMFFWRVSTFLSELDRVGPDLGEATRKLADAVRGDDSALIRSIFEGLENISIDYALMEQARRVAVARAEFEWDDLGAWDCLDRTHPKDRSGNVSVGDPILIDSRDCIVYNAEGSDRTAVSVIGAEGLAVVVCSGGVLVVPKDRAQDVRHAVAELKRRGSSQV